MSRLSLKQKTQKNLKKKKERRGPEKKGGGRRKKTLSTPAAGRKRFPAMCEKRRGADVEVRKDLVSSGTG